MDTKRADLTSTGTDTSAQGWEDDYKDSSGNSAPRYWFCNSDDALLYTYRGQQITTNDLSNAFKWMYLEPTASVLVGWDASHRSANGDECCATNTYGTIDGGCDCVAGYMRTEHYSLTMSTAVSNSNLKCVACSDVVNAQATEKYNTIALSNFLASGASASSCSWKSGSNFVLTGTNTQFRCRVNVDKTTGQTNVHRAMKCGTPSDEALCITDGSITCHTCTDVAVRTTDLKLGAVAGQCGCDPSTSTCNDDNSCFANAILDSSNQCKCLWLYIESISVSGANIVGSCEAVRNLLNEQIMTLPLVHGLRSCGS